jgi:transcriptional regulator with XRE-family HTH domain
MVRTAAPSPFVREACFVSDTGLSDRDIARATGAASSTVRAWLAGTRTPTGDRAERLVELSALIERLARVVDPSYIPVWLRKPVPALDDDKPLDVIGRGDYRRIAALVSALEESPTT